MPQPKDGQWRCPVCTLVNEEHSKSCEACNKPRPNKKAANLSPSSMNVFGLSFGKPQVQVYVDEDDDEDDRQDANGMVNINGSAAAAHQMIGM